MNWIALIIGGLFEVAGVTGIQMITKGNKLKGYIVLIIGFAISFNLLAVAMQTIPLGVSYAVWTGIGTVGSALVGMIFYGESKSPLRLLFMAMIIAAVVGLRLVSG